MSSPAHTAWPFPFGGENNRPLSRRGWTRVLLLFASIHFLALFAARYAGTFVDVPNTDHTPAMKQVLERGYPSRINVPPGFSYYLAMKTVVTRGLGLPYWTAKYFMDVFLVAAAGVLAIMLARLLTRNTSIAVISGIGMIGAPIYILGVGMEEAAILFIPLFLGSMILVLREWQRGDSPSVAWILAAGALMGIATLVRANSQFILLALAPVSWIIYKRVMPRRYGRATAVFILCFAAGQIAAMLPWTLLQRSEGREGVAAMPSVYQSYFDGFKRHRGNRVADALLADYKAPERSLRGVVNFNMHWLRHDPASLVWLYAQKFLKAWYMSDTRRWDIPTLLLHAPWWILASIGIIRWRRRCTLDRAPLDPALIFVLAVIGYMWTISAVMAGIARYSAPLYGLISLLAGVALVEFRPALQGLLRRKTQA